MMSPLDVHHHQALQNCVGEKTALLFCRSIVDFSAPKGLLSAIGLMGKLLAPVNHRGFWRWCRWLSGWIKGKGCFATLKLHEDCTMVVQLDDPYWSQLVADSYGYETDFEAILAKLKDEPYTFVDCGANFGYWSILTSGQHFNSAGQARKVLAIEAYEPTFNHLLHNAHMNHNRFHCLHRAIGQYSGQRVWIGHSGDHAGATVNPPETSAKAQNQLAVLTTTIDDAILNSFETYPQQLVVKLDVEGQEIQALKGSPKLWDHDTLLYYEDHGKDTSCEVTRFILEELKLKVFFVQGVSVLPITSVADAQRVKLRKSYGYNFFACKANASFLNVFQQAIPLMASRPGIKLPQ